MSKETMKLALEALEYIYEGANNQGPHTGISWRCVSKKAAPVITALREALAEQPAQQQNGPINEGWQITVAHGHSGYGVYAHMEGYPEEGAVLAQAIEQPAKLEPVATVAEVHMSRYTIEWTNGPLPEGTQLYTSPPAQRKPLTDEELRKLADKHLFYQPEGYEVSGMFAFARAIEAAHGIKEKT